MKITALHARQILDSRGNPTIEVDLNLGDFLGRASVPSGASTGVHEALELRDEDKEHFGGKGVQKAVDNVNGEIAQAVVEKDFENVAQLDQALISLDGTANKSHLGANAILGVSMAFVRAMSETQGIQTYEYIAREFGVKPSAAGPGIRTASGFILPRPMFNIMNGGEHANWATDIQEFMVIPLQAPSFAEALEIGTETFHALESLLKEKGLSTNVGNEGGFAPKLSSNGEAFELIIQAIEKAGFQPGTDVGLGVDFAASEFFIANSPEEADDVYELKADKRKLTRTEWIDQIKLWCQKYPIVSVEDPLSEDAWQSWQEFLSSHMLEQVVGDDFLVTNVERIKRAISLKACNALLVKLNQIGTVSETLAAMRMASEAGWHNVISHRSGETEDTFIAHLAVGTAAGQIKSGAPSRGERTAKYNELLRIEERLNAKA